jgi:hypothetical protein
MTHMNSQGFLLQHSLAAGEHSAPVTHIGQRIVWTVVTLAAMGGIYLLMWRGWKKRQVRQADVPDLPAVPEHVRASAAGSGAEDGVDCVYVSTTSAGDWLDRIAVHQLGNRSRADVRVGAAGIWIGREDFGAADIFIPAESVREVRLTSGMAGKYRHDAAIVVVTWEHGDRMLDSGLMPRGGAGELVEAIEANLAVSATERPSA